ncbi:Heat shock protein, Hsp 20 family [Desulfonema limicola]|uniref:Heat shock protein, Hsp 20 family n=1 Tax=Desulfonema limicola TaxID=45656 RepID=A0A975GH92_9BACT|nr:Hsp20/alpha crystallin family protein [Desulfonema limicola]QTA81057.1 Heat shock protein, Hsp 20 family [Desulfonema limicola]
MSNNDIQVKEKQEAVASAELTKPGPVFTPAVDIFETDMEIVLLADMPGVTPDSLDIDLRENTLTLSGEVEQADHGEEIEILTEYEVGKFYRQFSLSEVINQEKIDAKLYNGVLRLSLPKVEKIKPRKITVSAS